MNQPDDPLPSPLPSAPHEASGPLQSPAQAAHYYRELRRSDVDSRQMFERPWQLPLLLFLATCASTFFVGAARWLPVEHMTSLGAMWSTVRNNYEAGLTYMGAVLAILLTHEMGHFVQTIRHRIHASYPLFIPVPFNAIGTMGAVISMDGLRANRKQIFDIGLAGPLAGLAVAVPVLWYGVQQLDLSQGPVPGEMQLNSPVLAQWMIDYLHPQWRGRGEWVGLSQVNPLFMAGWVGMLITGLNMMPLSQLDGGHTIYGLFGRKSDTYVRAFVMLTIAYVVINLEQAAIWTPMLILVILMGIHHPPTSDDRVELDDVRWVIGFASLSIPILCFPLLGLKQ